MSKTPKLHELLAVEGDLAATAKKLQDEAKGTFSKRPDHFLGRTARIEMFDDAREGENHATSAAMVTTVSDKLRYVQRSVAKHYDALLQKDATNQNARADLVIEGATIAEAVPATALLGLENHLKKLRDTYNSIPTLEPGIDWELAPDEGPHIFRAPDTKALKTEKVVTPVVLYEATKEHPAQVQTVTEDKPVGAIIKGQTSGMISPAIKATLLGRIDTAIQATKRARQRANAEEVVMVKIGDALLNWINGEEV